MKMRAAVLVEPNRMVIEDVPTPQPGAGEVRVRIEGCGVCSSNLGPWQGAAWFKYPFAPGAMGHEGWGVVDAVGSGVRNIKPGQRVTLLAEHSYADYDVAPRQCVIPLPDDLEDTAFPGEPLGCVMNIFRRSGVRPGQYVAIVGIGFLGAMLTHLARQCGAHVIAISRRPCSLQTAEAQGAEHCLLLDDSGQVIEQVKTITQRELCPVVIEATGKPEPLELAGELTRTRGRLVIAGYHQDGMRRVNMQLWNWRGIDVINAHERDPAIYMRGIRNAVRAVRNQMLDPTPLLTHRLTLEQLPLALELTRQRPDGFFKAVVTM